MIIKFWIWFKGLWHHCDFFRWEIGYGLTPWGMGQYEYKVCRDCGKITGDCTNFVRDEEMYRK